VTKIAAKYSMWEIWVSNVFNIKCFALSLKLTKFKVIKDLINKHI
jgi:hypothetical protein